MEEIPLLKQWFRRGVEQLKAGRYEEALATYQLMLNEQPNIPEVHSNIGLAYKELHQCERAIAAFRAALALRPVFPEVYSNLGETLREMHRPAEAIEAFRRALSQRQEFPEVWNNLGAALGELKRPKEAIVAIHRALALYPNFARAHNNLGSMLLATKRREESLQAIRQAIHLQPDFPEAWINLGNTLHAMGRFEAAVEAYRKAISLRPDLVEAWNNLGNTLGDLFRQEEAVEVYRRAVAIRESYAPAWTNLGSALKSLGQLDEALACYERGLALEPDDPEGQGNRLYLLCFHPNFDDAAIYREARKWNDRFARPLSGEIRGHDNDPAPERRLRIGYVSGDFRKHCQSIFMAPLLACHDHGRYEIFCYSNVNNPDAVTAKLQRHIDGWRDISTLTDQAAAELIRQDKIDILVDLALHMAGCRLLIFARKPAPIQVTWLGYPGTTGLDAIDYRLTDPRLDPPALEEKPGQSGTASGAILIAQSAVSSSPQIASPGQDTADSLRSLAVPLVEVGIKEPFYSERSVHLPDSFWCYDPRGSEENQAIVLPDPGPLPALSAGHITFGCLNNFCKVSNQTLALWAQVMAGAPQSRLILLAPPGAHRERVIKHLGVDAQRISFVTFQPRPQYLATYQQIDLCLDTFPYNGHTTSLDSLWMGVPMVTRAGQTIVGRAGESYLYHLGLMEMVAQTDEQFVPLVLAWAKDLARLSDLRAKLRQRMERCPLMDGRRFAGNIEAAYRQMWQAWCRQRG